MDDLLREFLTESNENLLRIEQEIVLLEQRPDDKDLLGSIFRSMHTIKGTCGFLGLERMEKVAHAAENVLGAVRDGELALTDGVTSDVLAAVDVIKEILEGLEGNEEEPQGDDTDLIARLDGWLGDDGTRSEENLDLLFQAALAAQKAVDPALAEAPRPDETPAPAEAPAEPAPTPVEASAPAPAAAPMEKAADAPKEKQVQGGGQSVADQTLRVDVGVLDRLMNLAGELVLTRNQLIQLSQKEEDSAYLTPVQQLNRVTTDLQEAVMKTRMQPVGNAWGKLPRLVRDLASASGKKIDLVMTGAETELDRQILQAIRDPLTHMVRNSADHGIESPKERRAAGKPEQGEIVLEAFHEGGHIVIEIRDDGKGLDVDRIRKKAVERGVATEEAVADMPDHRVFEFIFEAGFSTAQQVTAVSGRGVGMDVVRRNIEKIGGTIEVNSTVGRGSNFRIKIPLTLAIMSALIVGVRGQSFAIPQIGVLELVRIAEGNRQQVENVNGALFYRLRDQLLPLVRLDGVLGFQEVSSEAEGSIVVCQLGASRFGVIVDAIHDTHEIVVKPVGRMVKGVRVYAGTTILGDGRVIMILDIPGIAQAADVLTRGQEDHSRADADEVEESGDAGSALLLFDAGVEAPRAVQLSQVSRLEEFAAKDIEWADGRWVVQYRGKLLPLVAGSDRIEMRAKDPRQVVVFSDGTQSMGLAVDAIRDIIQHQIVVEAESDTPGILGSIVVQGKTTELVDIDYYLAQVRFRRSWERPPSVSWAGSTGGNGNGSANGNGHQKGNGDGQGGFPHRRILLVDDSPFFLNMLVPVLRSAGFDVTASLDGKQALDRLTTEGDFDAVVSDIDMPNLDGFELARRIREVPEWSDLPLIALTSRDSQEDRSHGAEVGFDRYLLKFDQNEVLAAVTAIVQAADEHAERHEEALV